MFIFFGNEMKVAIPDSKIFKIVLFDTKITIFYDNGDYFQDENNAYNTKVESFSIKFDSYELALQNFRDFYAACESGKNSFYFG